MPLGASAVALLLLACVLAGCGVPKDESREQQEASARDMLNSAEAASRVLDPAAHFMSAQMIETSDPAAFLAQHRMEFPEARQVRPDTATGDQANLVLILMQVDGTRPDSKVGDGRAPRAAYVFEGAGTIVGVVVAADGSTVYSREWNVGGKGRGDFSWSIDTTQASDTLAAANPNFAYLREHGHIAIWDLVKPEGNAYWQVGLLRATPDPGWETDPHQDGYAADYCELGPAMVDATTGAILDLGTLHTQRAGKAPAASCEA